LNKISGVMRFELFCQSPLFSVFKTGSNAARRALVLHQFAVIQLMTGRHGNSGRRA